MIANPRSSTFRGISVIAALLCCLSLAQSAAAAEQAGRIIGWGRQSLVANLDGDFTAVAAGRLHSLGLKEEGSIQNKEARSGTSEQGSLEPST